MEPETPATFGFMLETIEGAQVAGNAVVGVVPLQFPTEHYPLVGDRVVAVLTAPPVDVFQRTP